LNTEDLKKAIALIYLKFGKDNISKQDFILTSSLTYRWFSPVIAEQFLKKSIELKLVSENENNIQINFDYKNIDIPLGFKLDEISIKEEKKDAFIEVIDLISEKTNKDKRSVAEEVNTLANKLNIYPQVALLVMAKNTDINISKFVDKIIEEYL